MHYTASGFLLFLTALTATVRQQTEVTLASECGVEPRCVIMTLDVSAADRLQKVSSQDSLGYTTFAIDVRGAIEGHGGGEYRVLARSYTDGIECSHLGQATVAVVGHSAAGFPIVLTSRGPLQLADTVLAVGCRGCATIRDAVTGRIVARRRTPGYALPLAGTRPESLFVGDGAELIVRRGRTLEELTAAGRFRSLIAAKPSPAYRLELENGACT